MKSIFVIVFLITTLALPASAEEETCDMLFVQDAKAMTFDGSRLTLKEANPNIIFFCDRPVRTAGHMTRDAFMKLVLVNGNNMVFPIKVLEGELPNAGETVIMFIDPIGRPMSPTSVSGAHRRHHRRAVRHIAN
jgi:hypothetical protein